MELREQIIEKEKALLSSEVRSSVEKLKSLISEDFREIGASGANFSLKEILECLPQDKNWSAKVGDFEFRLLADDVAQLTFRAFIKHDEKDEGAYSLRTSIWRNESGTWKMVFTKEQKCLLLKSHLNKSLPTDGNSAAFHCRR